MEGKSTLVLAATAAIAVVGGAYVLLGNKGKKQPQVPLEGKITQLWVYPIKSCAGVDLSSEGAQVNKYGFEFDREWVIAKEKDGAVVTQRERPTMKHILTALDTKKGVLRLSIKGQGDKYGAVEVPLAKSTYTEEDLVELEKWGLKGKFTKESAEVSEWLSQFLGEPVFLARCRRPRNPTETKHREKMMPEDRILGQDFSTIHVATEEALSWIQEQTGDSTLNFQRFRPNIVLKTNRTFPEEDSWHHFQVGELSLRTAKGCTRCVMPTINDDAQAHKLFQPTKTLRELHPNEGGQPVFGLSVFHDNECTVKTGAALTVSKRY